MRRIRTVAAAVVIAALMMSGCGNAAGGGSTAGSAAGQSGDTAEKKDVFQDINVSDYVTLGDYKELPLTVEDTTVTDEDVEDEVKRALASRKTTEAVTGRAVRDGDIVNIDYVGKKDGVAFDGGTASGYDLTIGSGSFIEGFEEGLIGAEIGEERTLNLTFPEEYHAEDLAGEDVTFDVKVNSISADSYPELTDDLAKEVNPDMETAEAFRENIRKRLAEEKKENARSSAYNSLLTQVQGNAEIAAEADLPAALLDQDAEQEKSSFAQTLQMYGMELKDYLEQQGMSEEEFDSQIRTYAVTVAQQQLLIRALAEAEGITVTDADMEAAYAEDAERYGYESAEDFRNAVKEQGSEDTFRDLVLTRKVEEMLFDNAKISNPEAVTW